MDNVIILEGPTGTGKTSVGKELVKHYSESNRTVKLISEFSFTPVGKILFEQSSIKKTYPDYLKDIPGALIYLSDKLYMIKKELDQTNTDLIIFDRFIMSQLILGKYFTTDNNEAQVIEKIILIVNQWLLTLFGNKTMVFYFNSKYEIIANRIENKIGMSLDSEGEKYLKATIEAYQEYDWQSLSWKACLIRNNTSIDDCLRIILKEINTNFLEL